MLDCLMSIDGYADNFKLQKVHTSIIGGTFFIQPTVPNTININKNTSTDLD